MNLAGYNGQKRLQRKVSEIKLNRNSKAYEDRRKCRAEGVENDPCYDERRLGRMKLNVKKKQTNKK